MGNAEARLLRRVAAEVHGEVARIERTVKEAEEAQKSIKKTPQARVILYGAAALLDTFYTGVEKAFSRIARGLGGIPQGPAWHRALLEDMVISIHGVRPVILSENTASLLARYLDFRHRFRNLYLFDLDAELIIPLLLDLANVWHQASQELIVFASCLETMAKELEQPS